MASKWVSKDCNGEPVGEKVLLARKHFWYSRFYILCPRKLSKEGCVGKAAEKCSTTFLFLYHTWPRFEKGNVSQARAGAGGE